jgi:vacuolar-type H+-ATPase subunit I/STV1
MTAHSIRILILALALAVIGAPQAPHQPRQPDNADVVYPSGKTQQDELLKEDHQRDLKDATQLIELAEQLKQELEKNDRHVLSISSVKKTEEIEKLAKRIHARLVR